MANTVSKAYWSDVAQRAQVSYVDLYYKITAAKTVTDLNKNQALSLFDAVSSQSVIDDFLGTSSEFLAAAFDATAMGTDAFAVIVGMGGQGYQLLGAQAETYSGSNGLTVLPAGINSSSSLTSSSHTAECALGSSGNMAARFILTGVDALTSGLIHVRLIYRMK